MSPFEQRRTLACHAGRSLSDRSRIRLATRPVAILYRLRVVSDQEDSSQDIF